MSSSPTPTESAPDPDLSGRHLGDYRLLRRLGRGAMAEVYLASQESLGRQVAVKILKRNLANDESYVKRFHNEARAVASLVHANIVQIHEVGRSDGMHYIAQEYVAGQNLRQYQSRRGPLDAPLVATILRQVASALHRAAEQGIIHRDIKPENILLSRTGEVKVADFGLARVMVKEGEVDLTHVGVTMGTPLYMSPEQVEGRPVDPRSDIYSLGVTCFQMLAGRAPFEGDSPLSVAVQHLKQAPPRLESLRGDVPEGLSRIVHKMLEKDPAARYQHPGELLRELRALQIDGLDEAWSEELAEWSSTDLAALHEHSAAATQQLGTAMVRQSRLRLQRRAAALAVFVVLAFATGSIVAWMNRPGDLLSVADGERLIEQKPTVEEQYWHAYALNTEAAWHSIARYFPPDESPTNQLYARRAQHRLAEFYKDTDQLERALQAYQELADLGSESLDLAAVGLAGQAVVYEGMDQTSQARGRLASLVQLMSEIRDVERRREIERSVRLQLTGTLRPEFERLLGEARDPDIPES